MAKKKSKKICLLPAIIGVVLVIVACGFLFAPGANFYYYANLTGVLDISTESVSISGFELFTNGITDTENFFELQAYFVVYYGISDYGPYLALQIALVLLAAGIVLPLAGIILGVIRLKKVSAILETLGGVAALVGGIMSLFCLHIIGVGEQFTESIPVNDNLNLATEIGYGFQLLYGLWITGIAAIVGGLASGFAGVKNIL